jgi:2-iminoacetate synthase
VRGRIVAAEYQDGEDELATGQFEISDERSPAEIAEVLRGRGVEPVWKDWDQALSATTNGHERTGIRKYGTMA